MIFANLIQSIIQISFLQMVLSPATLVALTEFPSILQGLDPFMKTALLLLIAPILASLCYGSLGLFYWWLWGW